MSTEQAIKAAMVEIDDRWSDILIDGPEAIRPILRRIFPPIDEKGLDEIADYETGLPNDYGTGGVQWWHDYLRTEIERANDHWRRELDGALRQQDEKYRGLVEAGYKEGWDDAMDECPVDIAERDEGWIDSVTRDALADIEKPAEAAEKEPDDG